MPFVMQSAQWRTGAASSALHSTSWAVANRSSLKRGSEPLIPENCPFCVPEPDRVFYRDPLVIGLWDGFPGDAGHALLIPTRHVRNWFEATIEERIALTRAIDVARHAIETNFGADGYNIGINSGGGLAPGVFHLHVHVIPRRHGDVGVPRWCPARRPLRKQIKPGWWLTKALSTTAIGHAVARDRRNRPPAITAPERPSRPICLCRYRSCVYDAQRSEPDPAPSPGPAGSKWDVESAYWGFPGTTDPDALLCLSGRVECRVYETGGSELELAFSGSFHPKAYVFHHRDGSGAAFIGSSNLSETALTNGVEWNYRVVEFQGPGGA